MKNQTTAGSCLPILKPLASACLVLALSSCFTSCKKMDETEVEQKAGISIRIEPSSPQSLAIDDNILLRFNTEMDASALAGHVHLRSNEGELEISIRVNGKDVELLPSRELKPNFSYELVVDSNIKSKSGITLNSTFYNTLATKAPDGYTMSKTTNQVTDFERDGSRMAQIGNYMYSFGGWSNSPEDSYNDVYRSLDLINWEKRADAPWHGRHVFGLVQLNGATYVMGGDNIHKLFDIWRTTDGESWTRLDSTTFGIRTFYATAAHNGNLYIVGGVDHSDVWRSPDGINWTKVADSLAWLNGENFAGSLASFNGRLWMVCGGGGGGGNGDPRKTVWSSEDGVSWREERPFGGSERYYTDVCVWDNKLWVVGGYNYDERNVKSIWFMNKRGEWHELPTPDTYIGRHATAVGVFQNRLAISCGNYFNDCWVIDKLF